VKKLRLVNRGQTIIEIIIATGIVVLVMTAIMAGLTLSLKNTAQAKYKALASKLGQEGIEAFRRERDLMGFETFRASLDSQTYCLPTIPALLSQFGVGSCGDEDGIVMTGVTFFREANVTVGATDDDPVVVEIRVKWLDATQNDQSRFHESIMTQEFKRW
jgi:hypothetical protein